MTKLGLSNHNLLIEMEWYCSPKIPREERLCSVCSDNKLEDKKPFLLDCPFYSEGKNALKLCFLVVTNIDFNKLDLTQKIRILFKKQYMTSNF